MTVNRIMVKNKYQRKLCNSNYHSFVCCISKAYRKSITLVKHPTQYDGLFHSPFHFTFVGRQKTERSFQSSPRWIKPRNEAQKTKTKIEWLKNILCARLRFFLQVQLWRRADTQIVEAHITYTLVHTMYYWIRNSNHKRRTRDEKRKSVQEAPMDRGPFMKETKKKKKRNKLSRGNSL